MTAPFMRAYALLLLATCHRRDAPAMGGMSALIPIKNDPVKNEAAMAGVRSDKQRDAIDGYDGGWVAHPGLVSIAMEEFVKVLGDRANQIDKKRDDVKVDEQYVVTSPPRSDLRIAHQLACRPRINLIGPILSTLTEFLHCDRHQAGMRNPTAVVAVRHRAACRYTASFLTGSFLIGISALMPPIAGASRLWHVATATTRAHEQGRHVGSPGAIGGLTLINLELLMPRKDVIQRPVQSC